jgi:rSAM/selenodomain-associated transferase 1
VFLKYPDKGKVKTRLASAIGTDAATELYRCFILDLLANLEQLEVDLYLCFHPEGSQQRLLEWLGDEYRYLLQRGDNLGQRMKNALFDAFGNGCEKAVVIGSDSPDLPGGLVEEAFSVLGEKDVVIGPASDGGYYLIGFARHTYHTEAFDDVHWSTDRVFGETMARLRASGLRVHVLPEWHDVDTVSDLRRLVQRNNKIEPQLSMTMPYIESNKDSIFG